MGVLRDAVEAAFRDNVVPGVSASGDHEPLKSEIRQALGATLEAAIGAAAGNLIPFATVAAMNADTTRADGALAYVYDNNGQADDPANGVYQWDDAGGAWVAADWYFETIVGLAAPIAAGLVTPEALALIAAQPGFDAGFPNEYTTTLPQGVMSGVVGGDAVTGATPGTYALTPTGGDVAGVEANLVVASATEAEIVIVNPGLGTGTTPPTWAKPAGATLPAGTTLTAVVAPRIGEQGIYFALSDDGLAMDGYRNDGTATPELLVDGEGRRVSILSGNTLRERGFAALPDGRVAVLDGADGDHGELDPALKARFDAWHDAAGGPRDQIVGRDALAPARQVLAAIEAGANKQLMIASPTDSWGENAHRGILLAAKTLQDRYGFAGQGWTGFGWYHFDPTPQTITFTALSNNPGLAGCARKDLTQLPLPEVAPSQSIEDVQLFGEWTCHYLETPNASPGLSTIYSSEVAAQVRWGFAAGHAAAVLHYDGDGTGVVKVSWDDGGSWSADIDLDTVGPAQVALPVPPSTAGQARIEVVTGEVGLAGVDMQSSTAGVRWHKTGASGSMSSNWAAAPDAIGDAYASLADGQPLVVIPLHATNDQNANRDPADVPAYLDTFAGKIRAAVPTAMFAMVTPPENQRLTNNHRMPGYAVEHRRLAMKRGFAHVDLQPSFGNPWRPAEYAAKFIDTIHPVLATTMTWTANLDGEGAPLPFSAENPGTWVFSVQDPTFTEPLIRLFD